MNKVSFLRLYSLIKLDFLKAKMHVLKKSNSVIFIYLPFSLVINIYKKIKLLCKDKNIFLSLSKSDHPF